MFTKQPTHVVKRNGSVVAFVGSERECNKFSEWANLEYPEDTYRTEAFR